MAALLPTSYLALQGHSVCPPTSSLLFSLPVAPCVVLFHLPGDSFSLYFARVSFAFPLHWCPHSWALFFSILHYSYLSVVMPLVPVLFPSPVCQQTHFGSQCLGVWVVSLPLYHNHKYPAY
jgi:hypothetical protein